MLWRCLSGRLSSGKARRILNIRLMKTAIDAPLHPSFYRLLFPARFALCFEKDFQKTQTHRRQAFLSVCLCLSFLSVFLFSLGAIFEKEALQRISSKCARQRLARLT